MELEAAASAGSERGSRERSDGTTATGTSASGAAGNPNRVAGAVAEVSICDPNDSLQVVSITAANRSIITPSNLQEILDVDYSIASESTKSLFKLVFVDCALSYMKNQKMLDDDLRKQPKLTLPDFFMKFLPATAALAMATLLMESDEMKKKRPAAAAAPPCEVHLQDGGDDDADDDLEEDDGGEPERREEESKPLGRPKGAVCWEKDVVHHYRYYLDRQLMHRGLKNPTEDEKLRLKAWYSVALEEINGWIERGRTPDEGRAEVLVSSPGLSGSKRKWDGFDEDTVKKMSTNFCAL